MSIESVMSSNHLILCCRLLLLPSIFPSIRVFSNESGFETRQLGTNICAHTTTARSKGTRKLGSGKSEGCVLLRVHCCVLFEYSTCARYCCFFFKLGKFQVPRNNRTLTGVGLGETAQTSSQRLRKHSKATRPQRGSLLDPVPGSFPWLQQFWAWA